MWRSQSWSCIGRWRTIGVVALAMICVGSAPLLAQSPPAAMPDSVRGYVHDAMAAFRAHSVHQAEVNWEALEDSVLSRSTGARTPEGTWAALTWALRRVDPHSLLMLSPEKMAALTGGMTLQAGPRSGAAASSGAARVVDGAIGLIAIPPHTGPNRPAYVDSLHAQLSALDHAGICGWVVDLRDDSGGNMWPMLAGIGPLLGGEVVGSFTNHPPGIAWHYRDGRSWDGDSTAPAAFDGFGSTAAPRLTHADAPVALLIGHKTASSGEITLLAFLGRPNVRSFGDSTAGYASSNTDVRLRDGATLIVTSGYPRDRRGRTYPLRIAPDTLVPASDSAGGEAPVRQAVTWLRQQPTCAGRR
jgi:carboxyl-terminal processing protease